MKKAKITSIILALAIVLIAMASCGSGGKKASVKTFEENYKKWDKDVSLTKTDSSFSYSNDDYWKDYEIKGVCSGDDFKSVTITHGGINASKLQSKSSMAETVRKDVGKLTSKDVNNMSCVGSVEALITTFGGDANEMLSDVLDMFESGKSIEVNGWTITAKVTSDECVITAK